MEEKPLNMKAVSQDWRIAEEDLTHLTEKAEEMMENVRLVEHVINMLTAIDCVTKNLQMNSFKQKTISTMIISIKKH